MPYTVRGNNVNVHSGETLLKQVLYYDRIDVPRAKGLTFGGRIQDVLEKEGIVVSTSVPGLIPSPSELPPGANLWPSVDLVRRIRPTIQLFAFSKWERAEPGVWALAEPLSSEPPVPITVTERSPIYKDKHVRRDVTLQKAAATRTLEVELFQSVPVPGPDVDVHDVLEFKLQHRDLLEQYRSAIEKMASDIMKDADIERARRRSKEQIQSSILELDKVMTESRMSRLWSNVKWEIKLGDMLAATSPGAILFIQGLEELGTVAALAGSLASSIKLSIKELWAPPNLEDGLRPYMYVWTANDKLRGSHRRS